MRRLIVYYQQDLAGKNIVQHLGLQITKKSEKFTLYSFNNFKAVEIFKNQLYSDYLADYFKNTEFIFASKHKSESKKPCLTVHTPGNWCRADFGGKDGKVCIAHASFMVEVLSYLHDHSHLGFDIRLEATHHGPYLNAPAVFVEIGSTEEEWKNEEAGALVASAINHALRNADPEKDKNKEAFVGLGGGHYAPRFSRIVLDGVLVGHIIPSYAIDCIDPSAFSQAIERNVEHVSCVLIDKKGTNKKQRDKTISLCEQFDVDWKKV